jgi:MFS family permease
VGANGTPTAIRESELRQTLQRVMVAWLFGAAWMYLVTGAALTRYARLLGVSEFGFGLLAAIPYVAALGQLPASFTIERFGYRKPLFLVANILHRSLWLVIAAIPWLYAPNHQPAGLIALMLVSAVAASLAMPSWYAWISSMVPGPIRGRYFSRRSQIGQVAGLAVTLGVGFLLDWAEGVDRAMLSRTLSVLLALGAVCGVIDILWFVPIRDRQSAPRNPNLALRDLLVQPLKNRSFRYYLAFNATFIFGVGFVGQFVWLYMFDVALMSNMQANLLLILGPMVVMLISVPIWGRLIDKLGRKPVLIIAGILVVHGSLGWLLVTRENWWPGYLVVLVSSMAWPGVDLASYNILLGMTERRAGSAYVAINSIVIAVAGGLSGVFGGTIAKLMKDWHGLFLGMPLTYHAVLFLISTVLRGLALLWLRGVEEPRAFSVRDAFHYMAVNMYSNLQNTLFVPVRLVGRWTYKLVPTRRFLRRPPFRK